MEYLSICHKAKLTQAWQRLANAPPGAIIGQGDAQAGVAIGGRQLQRAAVADLLHAAKQVDTLTHPTPFDLGT